MGAREDILTAVRRDHPPATDLPTIPDFDRPDGDLVDQFTAALKRLDGTTVPAPPDLERWLADTFPDATRTCSVVPELTGTVAPDTFADWAAPADVDVTVVRSRLGVAETGSILVTESELGVSTIVVLAQHLVVLLDPADIVANIHDAYRHSSFKTAAYAVLLSGPSGSADIGGITVHPGQGVTSLTVILMPSTHSQTGA